MTQHFTLDQVLVALREVVAENGADYLYASPAGEFSDACVYAYRDYETGQGEPSCLVGQVYVRLGIPIELILELDGPVWDTIDPLEREGYTFEEEAVNALERAQNIQDKSVAFDLAQGDYSWGAALRAAESKG
jgi:hypothetical protein